MIGVSPEQEDASRLPTALAAAAVVYATCLTTEPLLWSSTFRAVPDADESGRTCIRKLELNDSYPSTACVPDWFCLVCLPLCLHFVCPSIGVCWSYFSIALAQAVFRGNLERARYKRLKVSCNGRPLRHWALLIQVFRFTRMASFAASKPKSVTARSLAAANWAVNNPYNAAVRITGLTYFVKEAGSGALSPNCSGSHRPRPHPHPAPLHTSVIFVFF